MNNFAASMSRAERAEIIVRGDYMIATTVQPDGCGGNGKTEFSHHAIYWF